MSSGSNFPNYPVDLHRAGREEACFPSGKRSRKTRCRARANAALVSRGCCRGRRLGSAPRRRDGRAIAQLDSSAERDQRGRRKAEQVAKGGAQMSGAREPRFVRGLGEGLPRRKSPHDRGHATPLTVAPEGHSDRLAEQGMKARGREPYPCGQWAYVRKVLRMRLEQTHRRSHPRIRSRACRDSELCAEPVDVPRAYRTRPRVHRSCVRGVEIRLRETLVIIAQRREIQEGDMTKSCGTA